MTGRTYRSRPSFSDCVKTTALSDVKAVDNLDPMAISDDQLFQMFSDIKESTGRMEGKLTATIDAHAKRFDAIEEDIKSKDTRQWIVSACVIPVVTGLHYLANKIGIKV